MVDMILDWEKKIRDLCDRLQVDVDVYGTNNDFRESVARYLGFPSYESFRLFPNPKLIIKEMGTDLLPEHMGLALPLVHDCCVAINMEHSCEDNDELRVRRIDILTKYICKNFADHYEYKAVSLQIVKDYFESLVGESLVWMMDQDER